MVTLCTTCSEDDPGAFSKRMLAGGWARKGAPVRCRACVTRTEEEERAASVARKTGDSAAVQAEAKVELCSSCSRRLPAAAFSRSQLMNKKGEALIKQLGEQRKEYMEALSKKDAQLGEQRKEYMEALSQKDQAHREDINRLLQLVGQGSSSLLPSSAHV